MASSRKQIAFLCCKKMQVSARLIAYTSIVFQMALLHYSNAAYSAPELSSSDLRTKIEKGFESGRSIAQRINEDTYPAWQVQDRPIEYYVFSDKKDFNYGIFYAYLSILADASGISFDQGKHPQFIVIFAEDLKSWEDVDRFMTKIGSDFRVPAEMASFTFQGCNWSLYPSKGVIKTAVLIADTSRSKRADQIERCIYTGMFSIFGFMPGEKNQDVVLDSRVIRLLYSLRDQDRKIDSVVDKVYRTLVTKPSP